MPAKLENRKVAILVADGFEQVELTKPRRALDEAGAFNRTMVEEFAHAGMAVTA